MNLFLPVVCMCLNKKNGKNIFWYYFVAYRIKLFFYGDFLLVFVRTFIIKLIIWKSFCSGNLISTYPTLKLKKHEHYLKGHCCWAVVCLVLQYPLNWKDKEKLS